MKALALCLLLAGCGGAFARGQSISNWPFPGEPTRGDRVVEAFAVENGLDPFQVTCAEGRRPESWTCNYWPDGVSSGLRPYADVRLVGFVEAPPRARSFSGRQGRKELQP